MTNHGGTEQRSSREDEHAIASIGLFDRLDARNPFVLKDLAAAMSGRLPAVMLVLCLLSVIAIVLRTALGDQGSSIDTIYGQSLAERSTYSMIALSLSFVPFHVFVATVIEVRSRFADDLVLAGASAWQYVSGRLQFAFIALLLIASLFAPLFAAAHNLGGVSISNVLLGVGVSLVFGMPLSAAALLLAVHARFKVVGSLVPMLFLTGFWIAMALLTLGIFLAGVIQLIPAVVRDVLGPATFSAMFTLCFAYSATMVLAMPSDGTTGSFAMSSARKMRSMAATQAKSAGSADLPAPKASSEVSGAAPEGGSDAR